MLLSVLLLKRPPFLGVENIGKILAFKIGFLCLYLIPIAIFSSNMRAIKTSTDDERGSQLKAEQELQSEVYKSDLRGFHKALEKKRSISFFSRF
jgi:hypothetical protein